MYALLGTTGCTMTLAVVLSACGAVGPMQSADTDSADRGSVTNYSIICVIHGDGDYLYHDTSGTEYRADEEALAEAKRIGEHNPFAEVFIYDQKPRRHVLFLFPLHDGDFSYYLHGKLIAEESYWRDQEGSPWAAETALYRRYRTACLQQPVRVFVYCGHEIPEFAGGGYDASYPDRSFTVHDFATGVQGFIRDDAKFALMVLSTCFGGTPRTIAALGPFSRFIVASPENLHLSYFDFRPLERLDLGLHDGDVAGFAARYARQSFERLTANIQTAVSVGVYDVDRVMEYVNAVHPEYDLMLDSWSNDPQGAMIRLEHCDCGDLPAYLLPEMHEGVEVLYRPARFGRLKEKQMHSGWECWRDRGVRTAEARIAPLYPGGTSEPR